MQLQQKQFDYSLKNIPIPSKTTYMKSFINKLENFIRRLRWRAHFFDTEENSRPASDTFGFKTELAPPQHQALNAFENDLYKMARNIEFRNKPNEFQQKLAADINSIRSSPNLLIPADKTTNLYEMSAKDYNKLLHDNITKSYKKAPDSFETEINREAKAITTSLHLDNRIQKFPKRNAFVTLKDHKDNFHRNTPCRLINPAKSEIGKISKQYLDNINYSIRQKKRLNQWTNTASVISWFKKSTSNKKNCKFLKFDIENFYPSISENLLENALGFAAHHTEISEEIMLTIRHCRKSLLFCTDKIWVKKSNPEFDVTMGSFDGAEICELVGLYLLDQLSNLLPVESFGLYRDDGLAILSGISGPDTERIIKNIRNLFKTNNLKITIEAGMQQTDFLDVTFNADNGKYWPYKKPNSQLQYIHTQSNHPPNIKKQLPKMIEKRLSGISYNQEEFDRAKPAYAQALEKSGYKQKLEFQTENSSKRRQRKRNITWFNPPFSDNVSTNIGRKFLNLLDKHFPPDHKLHPICNRSCVKVSYSCMPNMAAIIKQHNSNVAAHGKPTKPIWQKIATAETNPTAH